MAQEDGERPRFVVPTRVGEEAESREEGLAILCSVAVGEAARFCARLEEEGIECGARAAEGGRYADVFVPAEDLEMAREVIARPVEHVDEGVTAEETEARLVANWICPRCGRRGLDLVPVAGWVKVAWAGLALTIAAGLVAWVAAGSNGLEAYPAWLTVTWVVAVIGLVWMSIPADRRRRCGGCGWESAG
jgi:hypothetical protein